MNCKYLAVALAAALPLSSLADQLPPADGKTISDVIETLEKEGYNQITEVQYDDKQWEAEAYKNGERRSVYIDPMSGEITKDKKDT